MTEREHPPTAYARHVVELRAAGWTDAAIAAYCGVSRQQPERWVGGSSSPRWHAGDRLVQLAVAVKTGVSPLRIYTAALYEQGLSSADIAGKLGVGRHEVWRMHTVVGYQPGHAIVDQLRAMVAKM